MNTILANIIATGDSGKPLLVAICLIVSIVLMVVLIMVGKGGNGRSIFLICEFGHRKVVRCVKFYL